MKLIIEAPNDKQIEANALKALVEGYLKGFEIFADLLVVVTTPYRVETSPDWDEVETDLYVRKRDERETDDS